MLPPRPEALRSRLREVEPVNSQARERKRTGRGRTFGLLETPDVGAELVDRLDVLVLLDAVEHDAAAGLEVRDAVAEDHGADRDARVHALAEVDVADGAGVHAAALALERRDELDGADLGRARDGPGGEDGAEGVEPVRERE